MSGGKRLAELDQVLHDPRAIWQRHAVTLWYGRTNRTVELATGTPLTPATAAWYPKSHCTFSDAIAVVRRQIWLHQSSCMSRRPADVIKIPCRLWQRAANALAYAA